MKKKIYVGAHTSAAGGAHKALIHGMDIGATTIQLFTANQKRWHGLPISKEEVIRWEEWKEKSGIEYIMSHDSYLINLGSPNKEMLTKSRTAMEEEIKRCHQLNLSYMNFHPGAATSSTEEECLETIVESLLKLEPLCAKGNTRLLLETTAGQGTSVGHCFEHLAYIIERVKKTIPIGVTIDTCHIFAAGYDLRTKKACDETLNKFDQVVGLNHLYAFHFNDSKCEFGSRKDRHANLGKGEIGIEAFRFFMKDPRTRYLPKYLETPCGEEHWPSEIALLKQFGGD